MTPVGTQAKYRYKGCFAQRTAELVLHCETTFNPTSRGRRPDRDAVQDYLRAVLECTGQVNEKSKKK